ncbi:heat shock 70 kDa protein 18-like [Henckelia pumila]|uniref:heat shock 70 kDa protein 18-like n=1 Tax=Henckelia pumila TaxID=405737 RepID=UPI003C6E9A51
MLEAARLQKHGKDIRGSHRALSKLPTACERAKRVLSVAAFATVRVDSFVEGIDFESKVTHSTFEELNSELFKEFVSHVESCLNYKNMTKTMIDDIILIGGSSRIPKLKQLIQEFFEGRKLHGVRAPEDAIAHGAALHAAKLSKSSLVQEIDIVMEEIGDATRWLEEHKYDDDANTFMNKRRRLQTIWSPVMLKSD